MNSNGYADNNTKNMESERKYTSQEIEDVKLSVNVISVFSIIHVIVFILYINFVFDKVSYYYGFENLENLPESIFVDRRYNFFWVIYFLQIFRIFVYFLYILSADTSRYSYIVYIVHKTLNRLYIFLDIVFIIIILILGWLNNSSWFPDNPCNSPLYCAAFGNEWENLCKSGSYIGTNPNLLQTNQLCTYDFWFTLAFLILDIIMYLNAMSFHLSFSLLRLKEQPR
jgi:hypothetical protein